MKTLLISLFLLFSYAHNRVIEFYQCIYVYPVKGGDSYPALQNAIDYCKVHGGYKICLAQGDFHISQPLKLFWINNGQYVTIALDIEGCQYAMNAQPGYTSNIIPDFNDAPAIVMQLNKGTRIKDITIQGSYRLPMSINAIQVDTLSFNEWNDHIHSDNRTTPYAGIVIDPFSDPMYFNAQGLPMYKRLSPYYIPGMPRDGSTGIMIEGCAITDFVVGVLETGSWQYNGEMISIENCRIQSCKVEIAWSQAQSKANIVKNIMVWGNTHTVFDGVNYGLQHTDASTAPFIEKVNIAGQCHQIFNCYASTFPLSAKQVYAEGIFKIGLVNGIAGTHFDDFQVDFQNAGPGTPSPDNYYMGYATTWTGGMLRLYNTEATRIVMDFPTNTFNGVMFNAPPISWNTSAGGLTPNMPSYNNCPMFYWALNPYKIWNSPSTYAYDDRMYLGGTDTIHVNRSNFNGYFNSVVKVTNLAIGDVLTMPKRFEDQGSMITGPNYVIGKVTGIDSNRVSLSNIGWGFHDGDLITPIHYLIKPLL